MRICVIGNSHVASLKLGWDRIASEFPGHSLTFFASRKNRLQHLRASDRVLVPVAPLLRNDLIYTSCGADRIDPQAFDFVLIYGLGFVVPRVDYSYSAAVCRNVLAGSWNGSISKYVFEQVRLVSTIPIFIGASPLSARPVEVDEKSLVFHDYFSTLAFMGQIVSDPSVHFIAQPKVTMSAVWGTQSIYSEGSKRLDVGDSVSLKNHDSTDYSHMNEDYGMLWIRHFFESIDAHVESRQRGGVN